MKKNLLLRNTFISGLLLALPWLDVGAVFSLFVAFVPFFLVEQHLLTTKRSYLKALLYSWFMFFVWNVVTTWWIWNATAGGAIGAVVLNALFYAVLYLPIFYVRKKAGDMVGKVAFVFLWISFEHIYTHGEIAWVWLNLGNAFAYTHSLVQWYEYTGTQGGTLWVLLVNVLIYRIIVSGDLLDKLKTAGVTLVILGLPIWLSLTIYSNYEEQEAPLRALIIQPNIDPYGEKFDGMTAEQQLDIILQLAAQNMDSTVQLVVAPETAISDNVMMNRLEQDFYVKKVQAFTQKHQVPFLIGSQTYKIFRPDEPHPPAIRHRNDIFYEKYNTAFLIDSNRVQHHHKSKLVVGVEKIPFVSVLKPLQSLFINLGGTAGGLGIQEQPTNLVLPTKEIVAPVICYESIFGDYVTQYVKSGAQILAIITNDGWWGNTPGHRQHLEFARLRAIETRRSIFRSANTGISASFNQRGDLFNPTSWWERTTRKVTLNLNTEKSFYVQQGDYIGRVAQFFSILLLLSVFGKALRGQKPEDV